MEEIKKYELTDEIKEWQGHTLHRIRALKDFEVSCDEVKAGDLGGWVEGENNLSQYDNCWIFGDAKVFGKAEVFGNAKVSGKAEVFGKAKVSGKAKVFGNAEIFGNAEVCNETLVQGERR